MTRYALELKTPNKNPQIGFGHKPNSQGHFMGVDLKINAQGWRANQDYSLEPDPGIHRLMFLGDSLTLGWGVAQEQTFSGILERKWKDQKIEVLNLGHGNFNSVQISELYSQQGTAFKPKIVVYCFFLNDVEPMQIQSAFTWLGYSKLISLFWSRARMLFPQAFGAESNYLSYFRKLYAPSSPGLMDSQIAIARLQTQAAQSGARFLVVMLPDLHQLNPYPFEAEHSVMKNFFNSHGIESIDLTEDFSPITQPTELWVARDDAHPNAKAHQMIANAIETYFKKIKILESVR